MSRTPQWLSHVIETKYYLTSGGRRFVVHYTRTYTTMIGVYVEAVGQWFIAPEWYRVSTCDTPVASYVVRFIKTLSPKALSYPLMGVLFHKGYEALLKRRMEIAR